MASERDKLVLLSRVAEQADRYEDMLTFMDEVALNASEGLTVEERKLLSNAYKTMTGNLRRGWRSLVAIETREANKTVSPVLPLIRRSKTDILDRLRAYCHRILEHVELRLLPAATTAESKVFYHKINGDYQRYLAESATGDHRITLVSKALESYKTAWHIADSQLPATDPTRLGLALNFSVFYFELLESPDRACHLAKYAFDTALESLDDLPEDDAADSIHILQLLKDNLSLWLQQMEIFPPEEEQKDSDPEQTLDPKKVAS
ncbi:tyrosine 3-monooxygenase [Ramaria rubella]|nr:tyrosine 3-monooxygenase [Ramaria rubella]